MGADAADAAVGGVAAAAGAYGPLAGETDPAMNESRCDERLMSVLHILKRISGRRRCILFTPMIYVR